MQTTCRGRGSSIPSARNNVLENSSISRSRRFIGKLKLMFKSTIPCIISLSFILEFFGIILGFYCIYFKTSSFDSRRVFIVLGVNAEI
jgi:hypothetical protein